MPVLTALAVSLVLGQAPAHPPPDPSACEFTVAADGLEPEIVGPNEVVVRTRVLSQPDSPLVVRRVDVSNLHLSFGGSGVDTDGFWTVDVQNVSDQAIGDAAVRIQIGNARGHFGGGPAWKGSLPPGETVRLKARSHGAGVDPADSIGETLELLVLIDSVQLRGCLYKPAQAIPRQGRVTR